MDKPKGEPSENYYPVSHITSELRFRWMTGSAQLVYFHLCRLRNRIGSTKQGWVQISDVELAEETGLTNRTILRCRQELERNGYIRCFTTGNRKACRYLVINSRAEP